MSEYRNVRIRKLAMKQARRNHSVFSRSSANVLSRSLLSCPWRKSAFNKIILKLKEQLQTVSQIASPVIVRFWNTKASESVGIALQGSYNSVEAHD